MMDQRTTTSHNTIHLGPPTPWAMPAICMELPLTPLARCGTSAKFVAAFDVSHAAVLKRGIGQSHPDRRTSLRVPK